MGNEKKQTLKDSEDVPRRRGRPAGKNRIPLSREERRARNAQYERERRIETAEVMSQLIEAAKCDPNISNAELLATVINRIQRATRNKSEDITELERINANLEAQIAKLQDRLGLDDTAGAALELLHGVDTNTETAGPRSSSKSFDNSKNCNLRKQRTKRKHSERLSSASIQPEKRTKTRSETCSVDSGIEMRAHTVSPNTVCEQDQNNMQCLVKTQEQQLPVEITEEQDHYESQAHMECLVKTQELPLEITEEQDHYESQAHMELQTELYNQIYNSESESSVESMTEFVASLSVQSQSLPCMERLTRSLIVVPSIVPPQQVPSDSQEHSQSDLTSPQKVELPCDFNLTNECNFLQQNDDQEPTLDFLTDAEKGLLSEWIGGNSLETSEFCNDSHMQVRSYSIDDILAGY